MGAINGFFGPFRFLSNFYDRIEPLPETIDEDTVIYYPTVEHAYQASKFLSADVRWMISQCETPKKAKALAWKFKPRADWDQVKLAAMDYWLRQKFSQPQMIKMLLDTGDAYLYETNTWGDRFWGVDEYGNGENHLGRLLMQLREQLQRKYLQ